MKMRIKAVPVVTMPDVSMAQFVVSLNEIWYDHDLDLFPKLRKRIIEHEYKHKKHRYNFLYHSLLDFKDYPSIYFMREFYDFKKYKDKKMAVKGKWWIIPAFLLYFVINSLYATLMMVLQMIVGGYYRWQNHKR